MTNFAMRVNQILKRRNMTQEQLALDADIDRGHVSTILSGGGNPTMKTLQKIAEALDAPVWFLLQPDPPSGTFQECFKCFHQGQFTPDGACPRCKTIT